MHRLGRGSLFLSRKNSIASTSMKANNKTRFMRPINPGEVYQSTRTAINRARNTAFVSICDKETNKKLRTPQCGECYCYQWFLVGFSLAPIILPFCYSILSFDSTIQFYWMLLNSRRIDELNECSESESEFRSEHPKVYDLILLPFARCEINL